MQHNAGKSERGEGEMDKEEEQGVEIGRGRIRKETNRMKTGEGSEGMELKRGMGVWQQRQRSGGKVTVGGGYK